MSAEIGLPVNQETDMDELVPVGLVGCQLPQFSHKTCCQGRHLERRWDGRQLQLPPVNTFMISAYSMREANVPAMSVALQAFLDLFTR